MILPQRSPEDWKFICNDNANYAYLDEDQEVLEHDLEGKEEGDQEGAAYWEQCLQCIEDDVADEVVESDERREDVECCSSDAEKNGAWKSTHPFEMILSN